MAPLHAKATVGGIIYAATVEAHSVFVSVDTGSGWPIVATAMWLNGRIIERSEPSLSEVYDALEPALQKVEVAHRIAASITEDLRVRGANDIKVAAVGGMVSIDGLVVDPELASELFMAAESGADAARGVVRTLRVRAAARALGTAWADAEAALRNDPPQTDHPRSFDLLAALDVLLGGRASPEQLSDVAWWSGVARRERWCAIVAERGTR